MDVSMPMMIAVLAGLLFCLVVHECAHGLVALWLGDETAKRMGRLTLNPLPHIDPFMSVILPLMMYLGGGVIFGGAKPVPVNPMFFRINRYVGMCLVAAAGPASNFLLAAAFGLSLNILPVVAQLQPGFTENLQIFLLKMIVINLVLALFNLLPLPPLDGSKIIAVLLPRALADWMYSYQAQVGGILVIAILVFTGSTRFLGPIIGFFLELVLRLTYFQE
jgi:Zn-dependent protease